MNNLDQAAKLEEQATIERNQGKATQAIKTYQEAKIIYSHMNDLKKAAEMQHMIGVCYKELNDLDNAIKAYQLAIDDSTKAHDAMASGRIARDIGIMFAYHDRYAEAEKELKRSKKELEKLPQDQPNNSVNEATTRDAELGISLSKLGYVYTKINKLKEAEKYLGDGLALIRKAGHPFYELTTLLHLATLHFATKHYGWMLVQAEAALGLIYEHGMYDSQTRRLAQIYGLMAHGYLKAGHEASAKHFAKKSLDIIDSLEPDVQGPIRKDVVANELEKLVKSQH